MVLAGKGIVVSFSEAELDRYARHLILHEIGGPGQQRLKRARVLVVGAGGLGSPVLLYLAAAGAGRLGIIDDDTVSVSNLQRQILHGTPDVDRPKVESAAQAIVRINPHVEVVAHDARLTEANAAEIVGQYDLVIDGCDNFATRYLVNAACVAAAKPLLSGAIGRWEGQISLFDPARGGPCYACVFPEPPDPALVPPCAEAGVIGALPGVVGSIMALEAIKHIARTGQGLHGAMLIWDGLHAEARRIGLKRTPDCPVCGSLPRAADR
jgi:molybdopterin/thiamine biosynthesis adenylyltransferase